MIWGTDGRIEVVVFLEDLLKDLGDLGLVVCWCPGEIGSKSGEGLDLTEGNRGEEMVGDLNQVSYQMVSVWVAGV